MSEFFEKYDAPDVRVIVIESQGVFAQSTTRNLSIQTWKEEDADENSLTF